MARVVALACLLYGLSCILVTKGVADLAGSGWGFVVAGVFALVASAAILRGLRND